MRGSAREKEEFVREGTMEFAADTAADTVIDSGFVAEWVAAGVGVPTRSRHSVKGS